MEWSRRINQEQTNLDARMLLVSTYANTKTKTVKDERSQQLPTLWWPRRLVNTKKKERTDGHGTTSNQFSWGIWPPCDGDIFSLCLDWQLRWVIAVQVAGQSKRVIVSTGQNYYMEPLFCRPWIKISGSVIGWLLLCIGSKIWYQLVVRLKRNPAMVV